MFVSTFITEIKMFLLKRVLHENCSINQKKFPIELIQKKDKGRVE